jgi:hypothetical protein
MPLELRPYGPQGHDVPRYMTYPTTDWFVEAFGAAQVRDWLAASERLAPGTLPALTVRLPGAADEMGASAWLGAYGRETALYARLLAQGRALGEVHWSLGRDSLPPSWLAALLDVLACGFYLGAQPRMSVTIDPACAQILPYLRRHRLWRPGRRRRTRCRCAGRAIPLERMACACARACALRARRRARVDRTVLALRCAGAKQSGVWARA